MCISSPKVPDPKPPAQFQQMQTPLDLTKNAGRNGLLRKQRGLYAQLFTSPQGIATAPVVTGTSGGMTG